MLKRKLFLTLVFVLKNNNCRIGKGNLPKILS